MMKKLLLIVLALTLLALPALAMADDSLTVIGTATVTFEPDMAELSVGVETHADTVNAAVAANSEVLNAVIEALKEADIAESDMATSNYYVGTEYDYGATPPKLSGYYVSNTLTVTVRDIERIGAVIDAATAAGANQVYGVNFLSSQQSGSYDRALTLAIQEGMRKAQLMAMAAGRSLGRLEDVQENGAAGYVFSAAYDTVARASGTSILSGELSVTASVTLTYELR